jgi:hypothetical protein
MTMSAFQLLPSDCHPTQQGNIQTLFVVCPHAPTVLLCLWIVKEICRRFAAVLQPSFPGESPGSPNSPRPDKKRSTRKIRCCTDGNRLKGRYFLAAFRAAQIAFNLADSLAFCAELILPLALGF